MSRLVHERSKKAGLPPGSLVHIGQKLMESTDITIFSYNESSITETTANAVEKCTAFQNEGLIRWMNVDGIHDAKVLSDVGECFGLHPLVLEDILNSDQRPKIEDYEGYLYIVTKMLYIDEKRGTIVDEQLSLILGDGFVVTFQEKGRDVFDPVRLRLRNNVGKIRKMGSDYLAYSILDALVDQYFVIIERLGDKIEKVEQDLIVRPTHYTMKAIHNLKREMLYLSRCVRPLREVFSVLQRGESELIVQKNTIYWRDVYDHVAQLMDSIDTFREILSGMLDMYLSSTSNRMNEVMKVLTLISTIFMPLTFLAGVYGMNFRHMPELEWAWSYPAVWVLMICTACTMFYYFKKKKWL